MCRELPPSKSALFAPRTALAVERCWSANFWSRGRASAPRWIAASREGRTSPRDCAIRASDGGRGTKPHEPGERRLRGRYLTLPLSVRRVRGRSCARYGAGVSVRADERCRLGRGGVVAERQPRRPLSREGGLGRRCAPLGLRREHARALVMVRAPGRLWTIAWSACAASRIEFLLVRVNRHDSECVEGVALL